MKKVTGIILIIALIFTIMPFGVLADNDSFCVYYDFEDIEAVSQSATFKGTHAYAEDEAQPYFIRNYLQFNSMAPEDTSNTAKVIFNFPQQEINAAYMYATIQFDIRMEDMANDNKNVYLDFPLDNMLWVTPSGRLNVKDSAGATSTYNLKTLAGWTKTAWTRIQLVFTLTDENSTEKITLSNVKINGSDLSGFKPAEYTTAISQLSSVQFHLSAHKTSDSTKVLYNADIDNFGFYITNGAPVFADKSELYNTITRYGEYLDSIAPVAAQEAKEVLTEALISGAEVLNNPFATSAQMSSASLNIENVYAENFFWENHEERRAYLYTIKEKLQTVVDEYNSGKESFYTAEEIETITTLSASIAEVYEDELAPTLLIEQKIRSAESILSIHSYAVTSVTVETDETTFSEFVPGGTLKSVSLQKRTDEVLDAKLYFAFYNADNTLENVLVKEVNADADYTGNIDVNYSEFEYELADNIRDGYVNAYLWDDKLIPVMNKFTREKLDNWEVYYNSEKILPDAMPIYKSGGDMYVGVKYLLNLMEITLLTEDDTYYAKRLDGAYIQFTLGESSVQTNKGEFQLDAPIGLTGEYMAILPFSVLQNIFGCSLKIDDINSCIYITVEDFNDRSYFVTSGAGAINIYPNREVTAEKGTNYVSYTITLLDGSTLDEVWYRESEPRTVNEANFNVDSYNHNMDSMYWHRTAFSVQSLQENEGVYTGSFPYYKGNTQFDLQYCVTTSDGTKMIYRHNMITTTDSVPTGKSNVIYTADTLKLVATYENIGYYFDYESSKTVESCEVTYCEAGSEEWKKAYEPFIDTIEHQIRGSIVKLQDNTDYEVKVKVNYTDTTSEESTALVTTWNDNPDYTVVSLEDYLGSFKHNGKEITEPLELHGIQGTKDNPVKVDCTGYSVDAGYNTTAAVVIDSCNYVTFEGLTVKGGYRCGVAINGSCENVRISNFDISGFGRTGVLRENGLRYRDGSAINYDAGILLLDGKGITIENCHIHDAHATTNSWTGDTWDRTHPAGSCGIYYRVNNSCVIRNNRIIGNNEHRWNDAIEGYGNGYYTGGPCRDVDIYGNTIMYGQDDAIELDGGQMNIRVYRNRIEQTYCGISVVPNLIGPSYLYENVITNLGDGTGTCGTALKAGGSQNNSVTYVFNNTCVVNNRIVQNITYSDSSIFNFVTRNNIFIHQGGGTFYKNSASALNDNDYDFCFGKTCENYTIGENSMVYTTDTVTGATQAKLSEVMSKLDFVDFENGDLSLGANSECKGAGCYIDNFCESENPNIGAY